MRQYTRGSTNRGILPPALLISIVPRPSAADVPRPSVLFPRLTDLSLFAAFLYILRHQLCDHL